MPLSCAAMSDSHSICEVPCMASSLSLARLSKAVQQAGIESPAHLEALALRLSPHQSRLFTLLLERGTCDTITIRREASLGNISRRNPASTASSRSPVILVAWSAKPAHMKTGSVSVVYWAGGPWWKSGGAA